MEWISVDLEMPKEDSFVNVWDIHDGWWVALYCGGNFFSATSGMILDDITHWGVPTPPSE